MAVGSVHRWVVGEGVGDRGRLGRGLCDHCSWARFVCPPAPSSPPEYNNQDWLIGDSANYNNMYDYTLCGLEDALGVGNVNIGVHGCVQCGGAWDPLLFLQHAANGTSACSGRPVHLSWTGNSFYEYGPGRPGNLLWFPTQAAAVYDRAVALGLNTSVYGIDEGRLLDGPEGLPATTRAMGTAYQASWDAMFFADLAYLGSPGAYYSRWGVNAANSLFADPLTTVDNVACNVAQLSYRMAGGGLVSVTGTGALPPNVQVGASVSAGTDGTLRVLAYHHYKDLNASGVPPQTLAGKLCGLPTSVPSGPVANAVATRVDDTHANFWPLWWADATAANLTVAAGDYNSGWSLLSDAPPIRSAKAQGVMAAGVAKYRAAAQLVTEPLAAGVAAGCVQFAVVLPPHGVALLELPNSS